MSPAACPIMRYGRQSAAVFVYFGDPAHPLSWSAEFVDLVDRARGIVTAAAADGAVPCHSIGVSLDMEKGIELLGRHKPRWDEVSLGGGPTNSVLVEHIWRHPPAMSTWPHVIILHRHFEISPGVVNLHSDHYLFRLRGPRELKQWVDSQPALTFGEAS
jgi:hypothetical protein